MSRFFNFFPKIQYDVNDNQYSTYETITNITFRIRFIRDVLQNIYSYTPYTIRDGDTPEILADKAYDDPEAHWMILYANDILDPQYDWPLDNRSFNAYIKKKYGSVPTAQTTVHHYEKVITYYNSQTDSYTVNRYVIDDAKKADVATHTTYATFAPYETNYVVDGAVIYEKGEKVEVSAYDWEVQQNDAKREIKIIKKDYYYQIVTELKAITKVDINMFRRV